MNVYLVPISALQDARYELYCEVPDEPEPLEEAGAAPTGFWRRVKFHLSPRRLKHRFSEMVAEAERQRQREPADEEPAPSGVLPRAKAWTMRWIAESIAEQRLLWHMRNQTAAVLFHPHDLEPGPAGVELRRQMSRDFEKHRLWLIVDSLGFIGSGLLFLVPGPNLLAYYFAFRMVGHYLSLRGARQALDAVSWTNVASSPLSDLRSAINMEPHLREPHVLAVERALDLERFAKFFDRMVPSAR